MWTFQPALSFYRFDSNAFAWPACTTYELLILGLKAPSPLTFTCGTIHNSRNTAGQPTAIVSADDGGIQQSVAMCLTYDGSCPLALASVDKMMTDGDVGPLPCNGRTQADDDDEDDDDTWCLKAQVPHHNDD